MKLTFTKIGDYYELSGEIAWTIGKLLGLTVTKGRDRITPMVGFPYYMVTRIVSQLEAAGYSVELAEMSPKVACLRAA